MVHRRVQGELVRLGHLIAASTVWQIMHDTGSAPRPPRQAHLNAVPDRLGPAASSQPTSPT